MTLTQPYSLHTPLGGYKVHVPNPTVTISGTQTKLRPRGLISSPVTKANQLAYMSPQIAVYTPANSEHVYIVV